MNNTDAMLPFVKQIGAEQKDLPGSHLPWLMELREQGITRAATRGLPTPRNEVWKYTNLRLLEKSDFALASPDTAAVSIDHIPTLLSATAPNNRFVFVNGAFRGDLSRLEGLPDGATIGSLAAMLEEYPTAIENHLGQIGDADDQPLLDLNTAHLRDGFVIKLAEGVVLDRPIEIVTLGGASDLPLVMHPRNLIILEAGSQATVVEHHYGIGTDPYFVNSVTEVVVGEGAHLRHSKLQAENTAACHIATLHARLDKDAIYDGFGLSIGGRLSRNDVTARLTGTGADCRLNGAYLMRGEQHCDNTTVIEHLVPQTSCREIFKGVLDDKARAVFQGRIVVHPDAQGTEGHQLSKTLLLSDSAEINAKPELEIYADDVKCSHGTTAGEIDHDAIFYLRSRGIPETVAQSLLIQAFLGEAIETIDNQDLQDTFMAIVNDWLAVSVAVSGPEST